ncbi:OmpA family lipoprotein [Thiosulfatimonas sediminis]|uniref:OmpA family lipoprotein n=1 Tax=Thiosulfatimonas sediminis TaxID=2675054 RepID=A0A6F8PT35_9GAMM|nr:OmpA family protein [Thiosulfatimonas sediminis]BBP45291.1 OmpA family lipoprotein [Thiosulfatimonas sediminis]
MKYHLAVSSLLIGSLVLAGCSQNREMTKEDREVEKNVVTGVAAIGGALMANALGMDNNAGKIVVGAITGFTARKVYEEVNKDTANDPNTDVTPVSINGQEYIQVQVKDVNFRSGSAKLEPTELTRLKPVLDALNNYPNTRVHVEGHTDSDGSEAFNQQLSENRAKNVAFYLMDNGISRDRIVTYGYGEERPIASNDTPQGKRMNRRVTFLISEI